MFKTNINLNFNEIKPIWESQTYNFYNLYSNQELFYYIFMFLTINNLKIYELMMYKNTVIFLFLND
jgi:hypothetical protein